MPRSGLPAASAPGARPGTRMASGEPHHTRGTAGVLPRTCRHGNCRLFRGPGAFAVVGHTDSIRESHLNTLNIRRLAGLCGTCLILWALTAALDGCTTEAVTAETARAMSTPGMGPGKFGTQAHGDQLQTGDQLQLTVLGYPEFNTTTAVNTAGMVSIPLIGDVKAVGLTKDQLEAEIVSKLSDYVKSKVYITLALTSGTVQNIIVLGAVAQQNSYPNTSAVSVFQILATAGGPSGDADLRHIKVYRGGDLSREEEIDLSGLVSPGGGRVTHATPLVNPGDLVYVPKAENFVRQFSPFVYDIVVVLTLFALVK